MLNNIHDPLYYPGQNPTDCRNLKADWGKVLGLSFDLKDIMELPEYAELDSMMPI